MSAPQLTEDVPTDNLYPDTLGFIVQLEPEVWLCDEIEGDPGRTTVLSNATVYMTLQLAEEGLNRAKKYRIWPDHAILPIFKCLEDMRNYYKPKD